MISEHEFVIGTILDGIMGLSQDKDEDGELDTNFFGIPSEPVGASYKSSFGKPSFDECSFELKEKKRSLRISFVN